MEESRVLAIDYGTKRIGLALSDPMKILATPFDTWENKGDITDRIAGLIKEKNVAVVLVGYPLNGDGSKTVLSDVIVKFAAGIKKLSGVEVELVDERYSSSIASERIISSVSRKSKRRDKGLVDKFAAAVLLEEYLNS